MTLPDQPFRVRALSELRALIPRDALPPDAVIRALEINSGGAYLIADLPEQLGLLEDAQGPPLIETGLSSALPNLRQETENTDIIARPADTRAEAS
ncbi:MAG: hypothetical protein WBO08_18670 [Mycobacterium sp.]